MDLSSNFSGPNGAGVKMVKSPFRGKMVKKRRPQLMEPLLFKIKLQNLVLKCTNLRCKWQEKPLAIIEIVGCQFSQLYYLDFHTIYCHVNVTVRPIHVKNLVCDNPSNFKLIGGVKNAARYSGLYSYLGHVFYKYRKWSRRYYLGFHKLKYKSKIVPKEFTKKKKKKKKKKT